MEKNINKTPSMKIATISTVNKTVAQIKQKTVSLLPVELVKTLEDANAIISAANVIDKHTQLLLDYAKAKTIQRVKDNELYSPSYDSFQSWIEKTHAIKVKQAYAKAKAAILISENGHESILPHTTPLDFTISKLTMFVESGIEISELKELCKAEYFTPAMTDNDIRKQIKKLKAMDETETETETESGKDETESGKDETESEEIEVVKTDILKVSFDKLKAQKMDNFDNMKTKMNVPQGAFVIVIYNDEITQTYYNKGIKVVATK